MPQGLHVDALLAFANGNFLPAKPRRRLQQQPLKITVWLQYCNIGLHCNCFAGIVADLFVIEPKEIDSRRRKKDGKARPNASVLKPIL